MVQERSNGKSTLEWVFVQEKKRDVTVTVGYNREREEEVDDVTDLVDRLRYFL